MSTDQLLIVGIGVGVAVAILAITFILLSSDRNACAECGKAGTPLEGDAVLASKDQMRAVIMKCPACGRHLCGACTEKAHAGSAAFFECRSCQKEMQPF
jgi:hypothetical protein